MSRSLWQSFFGPRVPSDEPPRRRWRYVIPSVLFVLAAAVLVTSFSQPYWKMTLHAPQYPRGLHLQAYLTHLEGDVDEIDGLNHYIGMRPLGEAAHIEKALAWPAILVSSLLLVGAVFIHTKWAALLALPALLFPAFFLGDLQFWLWYFGQNLDPTAALSSSVKPFTPPVLGEGVVGNFRTTAYAGPGLYMAIGVSAIVLIGLYFHRRAYKPLVDRQQRHDDQTGAGPSHRRLRNSTEPTHETRSEMNLAGSRTAAPMVHLVLLLITSTFLGAPSARASAAFDLHGAVAGAAEGEVIHVPAGTYFGPVEIDRPLSLVADGRVIIDGHGPAGPGSIIRVSAPDVTIRGFHLRNTGTNLQQEHTAVLVRAPRAVIEHNTIENALFGIILSQAPGSIVRNNTITGMDLHIARRGDGIRLWASHDTLVEGNTVRAGRDVVLWYSERVRIENNHITDSRYGLHFMYSHNNVLEGNHLERNSVGAFLMYSREVDVRRNRFVRNRGPSGYGLGIKDMQGINVEDNVFAGNRVAIYIDNPPILLPERDRYTRNVIAGNDLGVAFQPSVRRTVFYDNSFIENIQQVAIWGGGEMRDNEFTRDGRGNFWSDYRGYDADGDGIGDMPYRAEGLWDNLMDREPNLRLFLHSPAQQAVELAAQAFPVVRPRPLFTDDAPLMRPVRADIAALEAGSTRPAWLLATLLLAVVAFAMLAARPVRAKGGSS